MKNFRILTVAAFSLILLSGCSSNLPQEAVPVSGGSLSGSAAANNSSNNPAVVSAIPTSNPSPAGPAIVGDTTAPLSTSLPGIVDNPEQRNQKLVPDPANTAALQGVGGSGAIIDGTRDSLGEGSKEDKQQAAESFIAFVNLVNQKDYAGACEYVKLLPSQGTDCLAAMKKVNIADRTYPEGLKIDHLDNGVIKGDMATLNKLVFVYDGNKRLKDVYMFRPTDGSEKWKTTL
jgi:hypothetical protein